MSSRLSVAIGSGTWRSVRMGSSSWAIVVGNARDFEDSAATRLRGGEKRLWRGGENLANPAPRNGRARFPASIRDNRVRCASAVSSCGRDGRTSRSHPVVESQNFVGAFSSSGHSINSHSSGIVSVAASRSWAGRTLTRAKRPDSCAFAPSRQFRFRQLLCGRPSASSSTLTGAFFANAGLIALHTAWQSARPFKPFRMMASLNDAVRVFQQLGWNGHSQFARGLEVDHQLALRDDFDCHVCRFATPRGSRRHRPACVDMLK